MTLIIVLIVAIFYVLGLVCAVYALWRSRTPQGATAWVVGLVGFPALAVPLFFVFGRNKFFGYVQRRRNVDQSARKEALEVEKLFAYEIAKDQKSCPVAAVARQAHQPGFTGGNRIELLVDGQQTFESMRQAIERAERYVLFQFYIFKQDSTGNQFADLLIAKAQQGVQVYFMYDRIGTSLDSKFIKKLEAAGIEVGCFQSTKGWNSGFQINFRNHRKVIVVDGSVAFVGGLNIGDEYLGLSPEMGPWRDTHVRVAGPAALAAQLSFVNDWHWAKEKIPKLTWQTQEQKSGSEALILHTGPADEGELCLLAHLALINSATHRLWIANPYFVPPESLMSALALAVQRGVDVKILVPSYNDSVSIAYASEVYIEALLQRGVKFAKYTPGFLHQKVLLIDDKMACVGSPNLDSRSIFINFEIMAVSMDEQFIRNVEAMLRADFDRAQTLTLQDLAQRSLPRRTVSRAVALMSPML